MVACTGASTCGSRRCSPAFRALFCLLRPAVVARRGVRGSACSAFRRPCFVVPWPAVVARGEVHGVLGFSATLPAKRKSCSVQGCWKMGGCGEEAPWPCVFNGRLMRSSTRVGVLSLGRGGGLAASSPASPTKRLLAGVAADQRTRFQVLSCFLGLVAVVLGFFLLCSSACVCSVLCNLC